MNLGALHKALSTKTRTEFDQWVSRNEDALSNFFYGSTGHELSELQFDLFYFNEISSSNIYNEYHRNKTRTEPFLFFLNLIGIAAEKLALFGNHSLSKRIVVDLPDSPNKYRLKALNEIALVEDIRSDFLTKFPLVLANLDKSRVLYEEGSIRPIVDVLAFYYQRAKSVLTQKGLPNVLKKLEALFQDSDMVDTYPFLGHSILEDLIAGRDPFGLYVVETHRGCLVPSAQINQLFATFNRHYFNHPQIDHFNERLWGHTKKFILDNVLIRGRGDFTSSTGKITPDDKVMLYCFFNLKKHFFTSYAVFENVIDSLKIFFKNAEYKPVFIDLGCGPMTSGLALADLIHSNSRKGINMSYIGIDIAEAMLEKAKSFKRLSIFSTTCQFAFYSSWNDLSPRRLAELAGSNNPIIFNASYLFASSSLDQTDLAFYASQVAKNYNNVYFVFQNPNCVDRNLKYEQFKDKINYTVIMSRIENVRYKSASVESNEDVAYEILKLENR